MGANPQDVGRAVAVAGSSETGLTASQRGRPHNQAQQALQFALRSPDFGRTHHVTISVDAEAEVGETDEDDNRIRVTVRLPSPRTSKTIDPLACSMTRA